MKKIEESILRLLKNRTLSTDTLAFALDESPGHMNKILINLEQWDQIERVTCQKVIYWRLRKVDLGRQ
ncbi:MAG: hypothetical protein NTY20_01435 [Candidatus Aenigmarchaeota archaeon]|nr:hypothetical protein [Candidatus Aenigmarchaeota archaeon]